MARVLIGLPFAALVTALLFILMYGLIKPGETVDLGRELPRIELPFVKTDTEPKRQAPGRPDVVLPDLPPVPPIDFAGGPPTGPILPSGPKPGPVGPSGPIVTSSPMLVPISRQAPPFPSSCQSRGTEGYAVVEYDVTVRGQVRNARVVDSSHPCFERAALSAVARWQYRPALGAEGDYLARGERTRLAFVLTE